MSKRKPKPKPKPKPKHRLPSTEQLAVAARRAEERALRREENEHAARSKEAAKAADELRARLGAAHQQLSAANYEAARLRDTLRALGKKHAAMERQHNTQAQELRAMRNWRTAAGIASGVAVLLLACLVAAMLLRTPCGG